MIKLGDMVNNNNYIYWLVKVPGGYAVFEKFAARGGWWIGYDGSLKECRSYIKREVSR